MSQGKLTPTQEQAARTLAKINRDEIIDEAHRAKESGVSYGQYKAGIRKTEPSDGYTVHQTDTLHRTMPAEPVQKPMATIKRGIK